MVLIISDNLHIMRLSQNRKGLGTGWAPLLVNLAPRLKVILITSFQNKISAKTLKMFSGCIFRDLLHDFCTFLQKLKKIQKQKRR